MTAGQTVASRAGHEADSAPAEQTTSRFLVVRPKAPKRFVRQQVPDHILQNADLNKAIAILPANYNFEIHKTIWRVQQAGARQVALQFPEGLLMYACMISDILESFANVDQCFILGDVTYGACCIDDYSARALGADFLVHYGHSCLVPVDVTGLPCLYIFVDIRCDVQHLIETVRLNFAAGSSLAVAGTIQFASSIQTARQQLADTFPSLAVPQAKPLSPGEVLGCTAPVLPEATDAIVFVADGRFHLEAIMIANPAIPAYRYDPYARELLVERYDHAGMRGVRRRMVERARGAGQFWGLVLGTLGRQGNPRTFDCLRAVLQQRGIPHMQVLLSEVTPQKLELMPEVDVWVQIACPRLSIDWGEGFGKPTLTSYEAMVALGEAPAWWDDVHMKLESSYPMDYYASDGGPWSSSYHAHRRKGRPGDGSMAEPTAIATSSDRRLAGVPSSQLAFT